MNDIELIPNPTGSNKKLVFALFLVVSIFLAGGVFYFISHPKLTATNARFTDGAEGPEMKRPYLPGEDINFHIDLKPVFLAANKLPDLTVVFTVLDTNKKQVAEPYSFDHKENPQNLDSPMSVPINFYLTIPDSVEGGEYTVTYIATDKIRNTKTDGSATFMIEAPRKNPEAGLQIDLLSFANPETKIPVNKITFTPGEIITEVFYAVGFQKDADNKANLKLDFMVSDENKNVLLDEKGIVNFNEVLSADKFYVPMDVELTPPDSIPEGVYNTQLILTDLVTGKEIKKETRFFIKKAESAAP